MVTAPTVPVAFARRGAVRPNQDQIDAAILDTAAEMFARHRFSGTSIQQVADAVGYSKTGLLRRFASKQALYDAVVDHVLEEITGIHDRVSGQSDPRAAFLRSATSVAFEQPGSVMLLLEATQSGQDLPRSEQLRTQADALLSVLIGDLADAQAQARAVLALQLITNAAVLTIHPEALVKLAPNEMHELAIALAGPLLSPPAPA